MAPEFCDNESKLGDKMSDVIMSLNYKIKSWDTTSELWLYQHQKYFIDPSGEIGLRYSCTILD